MNNYSLNFGVKPANLIERALERDEVIENFTSDQPSSNVYMISGMRGTGKTVIMTDLESYFRQLDNWIVIDLSIEDDLIKALTAQLSNDASVVELIRDAKINLSFLGFGIEIAGVPPITDITVALERILERLQKKKKRVLIAIDEIVNNENVRKLVSYFQIFIRKNYPVFMLMTGLYENIYELQNEKTLTFLYRAPKIRLKPLNLVRIADNYEKVLGVSKDDAIEMANITKGYPYAFQVLGYTCCKSDLPYVEVIDNFDLYMGEYVYDKIWHELSAVDKKTLRAIAMSDSKKAKEVRELSGQTSNQYNRYRSRLLAKGVITEGEYGHVEFTLPRFKEYILRQRIFNGDTQA